MFRDRASQDTHHCHAATARCYCTGYLSWCGRQRSRYLPCCGSLTHIPGDSIALQETSSRQPLSRTVARSNQNLPFSLQGRSNLRLSSPHGTMSEGKQTGTVKVRRLAQPPEYLAPLRAACLLSHACKAARLGPARAWNTARLTGDRFTMSVRRISSRLSKC